MRKEFKLWIFRFLLKTKHVKLSISLSRVLDPWDLQWKQKHLLCLNQVKSPLIPPVYLKKSEVTSVCPLCLKFNYSKVCGMEEWACQILGKRNTITDEEKVLKVIVHWLHVSNFSFVISSSLFYVCIWEFLFIYFYLLNDTHTALMAISIQWVI